MSDELEAVALLARIIHDAGPCDDPDCIDPNDWGYCDKRAAAVITALPGLGWVRGDE
jgi:hypothetical protein